MTQQLAGHGARGTRHLRDEVRRDLEAGQLVAVYQPFVNLSSGRVQGYEAFVRRGPSSAGREAASFLPAANDSDLICDIDAWVLCEALAQLARWHRAMAARDLILAVNLAGRHVRQARVVKDVCSALQAAGVQPDRLLLDVTELAAMREPDAVANLQTLRQLEVSVCLDSAQAASAPWVTPASLAELPVDILKLNPGWLADAADERGAVLGLVGASQDIGLPTVAGGIETAEHLDYARELGCEWAQGFFLGAPATADGIAVSNPKDP